MVMVVVTCDVCVVWKVGLVVVGRLEGQRSTVCICIFVRWTGEGGVRFSGVTRWAAVCLGGPGFITKPLPQEANTPRIFWRAQIHHPRSTFHALCS